MMFLAIVKHIIDDDDWWYTACICNKTVYPDSKMFFCEKCTKHVMKVVPRYRIKVRVIDNTDSANFVIFDRDATLFFNNKSCVDLFEAHDKSGQGLAVPKEISDLVDKSFVFKVEFKNDSSSKFEQSFRVKKICSDPSILNKFNELFMKSVDVNLESRFLGTGKETMTESSIGLMQNLMPNFSCAIVDNESQYDERDGCDLSKDSDELSPPLKRVYATKQSQPQAVELAELELPLKMLKKNIKVEKE